MKAYLDIYRNVIAVDYFWRERLGISRLNRLNYRPWKYPFLNNSRLIFSLFYVFWPVALIFSNFCYFCRSMLFPFVKSRGGMSAVWIESSLKSEQIRKSLGRVDFLVVDIRFGEYFFYLSRFDRLRLFFSTVGFIFWLGGRVNASDRVQFFDCYRVFCFLSFASRLNGLASELHICNHYDRWAMACFEGFLKGVHVWQHGLLDKNIDLPVKLENIRCVNSLSVRESELWRGYLADSDVNIFIRESSFSLSSRVNKIDVLLIGHPAYVSDEVEFLVFLGNNLGGMNIAYKPHPTCYCSSLLGRLQAEGIDVVSLGEYPEAVLAIAKGSTLGHEYESVGVDVIWWGDENFSDLVELIKSRLLIKF